MAFNDLPMDAYKPLKDRYQPPPTAAERNSLHDIIIARPSQRLFVPPWRWRSEHLELLEIYFVPATPDDTDRSVEAVGFNDNKEVKSLTLILDLFCDLQKSEDIMDAELSMSCIMESLLVAVKKREEERCGNAIRGTYYSHTLSFYYNNVHRRVTRKNAPLNVTHGFRIPLWERAESLTLEERINLARSHNDHRLTWAYVSPMEFEEFRKRAVKKGERRWCVQPLVAGMLIELAQEAQRKDRFEEGRSEFEVSIFVAEYKDSSGPPASKASTDNITPPSTQSTASHSDPGASGVKSSILNEDPSIHNGDFTPSSSASIAILKTHLSQYTATIPTSYLLKFSSPRTFHDASLTITHRSWPVVDSSALNIFHAVWDASLGKSLGKAERMKLEIKNIVKEEKRGLEVFVEEAEGNRIYSGDGDEEKELDDVMGRDSMEFERKEEVMGFVCGGEKSKKNADENIGTKDEEQKETKNGKRNLGELDSGERNGGGKRMCDGE